MDRSEANEHTKEQMNIRARVPALISSCTRVVRCVPDIFLLFLLPHDDETPARDWTRTKVGLRLEFVSRTVVFAAGTSLWSIVPYLSAQKLENI